MSLSVLNLFLSLERIHIIHLHQSWNLSLGYAAKSQQGCGPEHSNTLSIKIAMILATLTNSATVTTILPRFLPCTTATGHPANSYQLERPHRQGRRVRQKTLGVSGWNGEIERNNLISILRMDVNTNQRNSTPAGQSEKFQLHLRLRLRISSRQFSWFTGFESP